MTKIHKGLGRIAHRLASGPTLADSSFSAAIGKLNTTKPSSRHITKNTARELGPLLAPASRHAKQQGAVDCEQVTRKFLVASAESSAKAGPVSSIFMRMERPAPLQIGSSSKPSAAHIAELHEKYGPIKLKAKGLTVSPAESRNGLGSRFPDESFHCVVVVKVFQADQKTCGLIYDPEGNCGETESETFLAQQLATLKNGSLDTSAFSQEEISAIEQKAHLFRLVDLEKLLEKSDFAPYTDSLAGDELIASGYGCFVVR